MADNALFKLARQPQVKQRGTILPIAEYDDGSYGMAWPEMLHAPAMAFKRAVDSGMPLSTTDPDAAEAAYRDMGEVALGTMLGGSVASMGSGAARGAVGSAGGKMTQPQGIRAYHGSPHDFDRFSLDKIGTGEGAQAYGHGLYFADSEDVARSYRDALTKPSNEIDNIALEYWYRNGKKAELAKRHLAQEFEPDGRRDKIEAAIDRFATGGYNEGRMYEVNIKGDPNQFLDWDAPLTKQPDTVQKALAPFLGNDPVKFDIRQGPNGYLVNIVNTHNGSSGLLGPFKSPREAAAAAQNYRPAEWDANTQKAGDYLRQKLTDPNTAAALREAGIPGIRYLDGASRGAGAGSSNYVVFDDQLVDILRKYQNPPTGAALPLAADGGEQQDIEPALLAYLKQIGLY